MKKIIVLISIAALIGGGVLLLHMRKSALGSTKVAKVLPAVVDSAVVTRDHITLTLPAMAQVASEQSVTLSTKVSGHITRVLINEGSKVSKGEIVARIDSRELEAKLESLKLQCDAISFQIRAKHEEVRAMEKSLQTARKSHERTLELVAIKGASIEQSENEEATIGQLEAKLSAAKNAVSTFEKQKESIDRNAQEVTTLIGYTVIKSPTNGTVAEQNVNVGDLATPGKALFRISGFSGLYLRISLPANLHATQAIFHGKRLPLSTINEAGSSGLAQYIVRLPESPGFVEGQYVNLNVVLFDGQAVLLPIDALLQVNNEAFIFVLEGGKAVKVPVTITARGVEGITVKENLAGEEVILAKPDILLRIAAGVPVFRLQGENQQNG